MEIEIVTVPCLEDNYAFIVRRDRSVALVDAPEAGPIAEALSSRGWGLDEIWITHHHADHVGGVDELRRQFGARILGARPDAHRLPDLDHALEDGEVFDFAGAAVTVIDVPGHTLGHIAYHLPEAHAVFTADSLMALGCGRVFEGTMEQMWESLSKLSGLPADTVVYSGHEYTMTNARFALTIEPGNEALRERARAVEAARSSGRPTVPSTLAEEKATNPFLRAGLQAVKADLDMTGESDAAVFAEIRRRKDSF